MSYANKTLKIIFHAAKISASFKTRKRLRYTYWGLKITLRLRKTTFNYLFIFNQFLTGSKNRG